jgi:WD40 repeat protein
MNLELLDPFRRQIPDRVIATLTLPPVLHGLGRTGVTGGNGNSITNGKSADETATSTPATATFSSTSKKSSSQAAAAAAAALMMEEDEWKAVYHVAFNRRGSYVAVGYASGNVAVYDVQSRTLAALYRDTAATPSSATTTAKKAVLGNGVTSVTWSRRSRTLLAGAVGDAHVRLMDTTHPNGPEECCLAPNNNTQPSSTTAAAAAVQQPPPSLLQSSQDGTATTAAAAGGAGNSSSALLNDDSIRESSVLDESDPFWGYMTGNTSLTTPGSLKSPNQLSSLATADQTYDYVSQARHLLLEQVPRSESSTFHVGPVATAMAAIPLAQPAAVGVSTMTMEESTSSKRVRRYPSLVFSFPHPVGGSLQVHPRETTAGLAVLSNGSLVVFWAPPWAWEEEILEEEFSATVIDATAAMPRKRRRSNSTANDEEDEEDDYPMDDDNEQRQEDTTGCTVDPMEEELGLETKAPADDRKQATATAILSPPGSASHDSKNNSKVQLATVWENHHYITCAAFDPQGERIYAATKDGSLLGFEVKHIFEALKSSCPPIATATAVAASAIQPLVIPPVSSSFQITIPGGSTAWHLIVSRNGRTLVINSADGALRLYSTAECWSAPESVERPNLVFQDIISKVKFASCDISGDGEYVVGGANGNVDNKYELYIWNTTTGALLDKLTGPPVQLYSVAWHPTRSFLAVAASDGMVDVWGPPINWTAFAPDFQALPANVEYVEREDEFDIVAVHRADKKDELDEEAGNLNPQIATDDVPVTDDDDDEKKDVVPEQDYYVDGNHDEGDEDKDEENERAIVDVVSVEPVPVFASDSEDEEETFTFLNKVTHVKGGLRGRYKRDLDDKD